jgi:hypothetical protein
VSKHEHFEELAAVAAIGRLTPLQVEELSRHLAECDECRLVHDEFVELHAPLKQANTSEIEAMIAARRDRVKSAVLQSVAAKQESASVRVRQTSKNSFAPMQWRFSRLLAAGALAAATTVAAFWLGIRYDRANARAAIAVAPMNDPGLQKQIMATPPAGQPTVEPSRSGDESKFATLENDLRSEKQRSARLTAALAEQAQRLTDSEQKQAAMQQRVDSQSQEILQAQSTLLSKTQELSKSEAAKTEDFNSLVALRYEVQDLRQKLGEQNDSLEREKQLLASGRDVRDIIGARNLHIIDVYDRGPAGDLKRSFARAFYTEGKSLIFYAYDLPTHGTEGGTFAYTAWGEKNGNKKAVRNLGLLMNDDKGQRRWVLNFSDPKVLAEIDSVFVTLERVDRESVEPKGKRMLTAYLDSRVNHP